MYSKGWKLAFTFALLAGLSACGKKKNNNNGNPPSPYTGIWVTDDGFSAYERLEREMYSPAQFCQSVFSRRHGLSRGMHQIQLDALMVNPNGEVYIYNPNMRQDQVGYRESNFIGSVDGQGFFSRVEMERTSATYSYREMHNPYGRPAFFENSRFDLDEGHLLVNFSNSGEWRYNQRIYRPVADSARVSRYFSKVMHCLNSRYDVNQNGDYYPGTRQGRPEFRDDWYSDNSDWNAQQRMDPRMQQDPRYHDPRYQQQGGQQQPPEDLPPYVK